MIASRPASWWQKNTRKLAVMKLMRNIMLIIPVIALFYTDHGLTLTQIGLLQSIFSLALVSLEVPTGYISDRWGRKASLIVGNMVIVLGYLRYRQGATFWQFAGAEIVLALGRACISGSDSALLYDTLKQAGKAQSAKKWEGRIGFAGDIAGVIGGILGGFVGHALGYDILWLRSAGFVVVALLLSLTLEEVRGAEHHSAEYHIRHDAKEVGTQFWTQPRLFWLIIFTGLIAYATYSLVRVQQQRLQALGAPVAWFGVLRGVSRACVASGGLGAHRYDAYFGHTKSMGGLLLGILLGFGLMAVGIHRVIPFIGLCVAFLIRGLQGPLTTYYINEQTGSRLRATMLSSMSMIHRLFFACLLPLQGRVSDTRGMQTMFVVMLLFFGVLGGWSWTKLVEANR